MWQRGDCPDRALVGYLKRNLGKRRRQLMVFLRKFQDLSEIGAGKHRITVHSVGRKMDGRANTERSCGSLVSLMALRHATIIWFNEMRVAGECSSSKRT